MSQVQPEKFSANGENMHQVPIGEILELPIIIKIQGNTLVCHNSDTLALKIAFYDIFLKICFDLYI